MMTTHHAYSPVVETSPEASDKALVAQIAAAYFSHNPVPHQHIPDVLRSIKEGLATEESPVVEDKPRLTASEIRKSITPDFLVSFEDGKKYKTLKRHLAIKGMTPEDYREKWGLPHDYPMVAPAYSAQRTALAKSMGLGRQRPPEPVVVAPTRGKRGGGSTGKRETASAAA